MADDEKKEQADKCIEIALKALEDKDWSKAEKFLEKSMRLQQSNKAQNLLFKLDTMRRRDNDFKKQQEEEKLSPKVKQEQTQQTQSSRPSYTNEQVQICKSILAKKDYYSILGIEKNANDDEIKKVYKKLAIKFHPDKNSAPQASEAFKKVSAAYVCLSDPEKRRHYDQTGEEPGNQQPQQRQQYYRQEVDPDMIFRTFFGGGHGFGHSERVNVNNRQRQQQNRNQDDPVASLKALIPLLFVILISWMSTLGSSPSNYQNYSQQASSNHHFSFTESYQFPNRLVSANLEQTYFVSEYTFQDLRRNINRKRVLDDRVEDELIDRLKGKCQENKRLRDNYLKQAKKYSTHPEAEKMYKEKAQEVDLKTCNYYHDSLVKLDQAQMQGKRKKK